VQVLNETYSEGLRKAMSRPGSSVDDAAFISIDRLGADVRVRRATDYIVERITFPTVVTPLPSHLYLDSYTGFCSGTGLSSDLRSSLMATLRNIRRDSASTHIACCVCSISTHWRMR